MSLGIEGILGENLEDKRTGIERVSVGKPTQAKKKNDRQILI